MYYPDQRFVSKLTTIHREALLPEEAIGNVRTHEGARVDIRDVVAHGAISARHVIIPAAEQLGLRNKDNLEKLLLIKIGATVDAQTPIAGKNAKRGRRVFSPVRGVVTAVDKGRIIMQEYPELIDLEAGVRGRVVRVYPGRGVAIEAVGAVVQGVWGNGKRIIATLRSEPKQGLESLVDTLDTTYKGSVMVFYEPLDLQRLALAERVNISGIIAPSLPAPWQERVMNSPIAIMLTEGFGDINMSNEVLTLLTDNVGFQITLDAYTPGRWEPRRPEAIINRRIDERPPGLNWSIPLRVNQRVRLTREPHLGQMGKVVELPRQPIPLANGLRVKGARVELITGETIAVPFANLELAGR